MLEIKQIDEVKEAQSNIAQGQLTLWNTRLEALNKIGDVRGVIDHIMTPLAGIADNCDCHCGGAGTMVAGINPAAKVKE
jgi:hypothetical protein